MFPSSGFTPNVTKCELAEKTTTMRREGKNRRCLGLQEPWGNWSGDTSVVYRTHTKKGSSQNTRVLTWKLLMYKCSKVLKTRIPYTKVLSRIRRCVRTIDLLLRRGYDASWNERGSSRCLFSLGYNEERSLLFWFLFFKQCGRTQRRENFWRQLRVLTMIQDERMPPVGISK